MTYYAHCRNSLSLETVENLGFGKSESLQYSREESSCTEVETASDTQVECLEDAATVTSTYDTLKLLKGVKDRI